MDEMRCSCRIKFIQLATLTVAAAAFAINGGIQKILDQAVRKLNITSIVHPILTNVPILYSLKTSANHCFLVFSGDITQLAITYSKLTIETLEQGVKYVHS